MPAVPPPIKDLGELQLHLQTALELELTTIPPYLIALCTIRPGTNPDARDLIGSVMMDEMLHMALAANVLNAVGGAPLVAHKCVVPQYPATLPVGREGPLTVDLRRFSPEAIATFLAIEYPRRPSPAALAAAAEAAPAAYPTGPGELAAAIRAGEIYASIGDFYEAIQAGLSALETKAQADGQTIFTGDAARQLPAGAYYNFSYGAGGGELYTVTDLATAQKAIQEIVDQGEGYGDTIGDGDDVTSQGEFEVAHYYRFNQIAAGRKYGVGDKPDDAPSGKEFKVDYTAVGAFPMIDNPSPDQYAGDQALIDLSNTFDATYSTLLRGLQRAFNGEPDAIDEAVGEMRNLPGQAADLITRAIPGGAGNAGPGFRYVEA